MRRGHPLPADIREHLAALDEAFARRPAVVFAYLFGGAASGRLTPLSDVDVAVYLDETADPDSSTGSARSAWRTWSWSPRTAASS